MESTSRASHPDMDALWEYLAGSLPQEQAEEIREHLVDCSSCLEQFLELERFEASSQAPADPALETKREADWRRLRSALPSPGPTPKRTGSWAAEEGARGASREARWLPWAAAAGFAALALGTGFTTLHFRDLAVETEAQLAASLEERAELAAEVEELSSTKRFPAALALAIRPAFRVRASEALPLLEAGSPNELKLGLEPGPTEVRIELPATLEAAEVLFLLRNSEGEVLAAQVKAAGSLRGDLGTALSLPPLDVGEYRLEVVALAGLEVAKGAGYSLVLGVAE